MRVALVQEHVDIGRGGAETSTIEMARHLADRGLDVSVLHAGSGALFIRDNVRYHPLAAPGATRALRTYRFIRAAQDAVRIMPFDIVQAITPCPGANVYQPRGGTYRATIDRTLARSRPPWRWVRSFGRRFNIRQRFLFRLERAMLTRHGGRVHVAAVSDYVRRQVEAEGGRNPARVRVVFNGVGIAPWGSGERAHLRDDARHDLRFGSKTPVVLFVAHNFRLKGLIELLRALAAGDADWRLIVAGRDDADVYVPLVKYLGLAERVKFVGAAHDVRRWYAAADVLAHPTWYDPCSRVVLESLSLGMPVVTTRYNGAAEVLEVGRHGMVVDEPDDIDGLVAGLREALRPAVRAACHDDSARLHAQLSMARHVEELHTLYEDILAGRASGRLDRGVEG